MIKTIHSYWAYLVLVVLILAVLKSLIGYFGKKDYDAKAFRVSLFTLIVSHIQGKGVSSEGQLMKRSIQDTYQNTSNPWFSKCFHFQKPLDKMLQMKSDSFKGKTGGDAIETS